MSKVLGVVLALLAVPASLGLATAGAVWLDSGSATASHTTGASVGTSPRVTIQGLGSGSLTVRAGPAGSVEVQARSTVRGLLRGDVDRSLGELRPVIQGGGTDAITIAMAEAPRSGSFGFSSPISSRVDLTVTVPAAAAVTVAGAEVVTLDHLAGPVQIVATVAVVRLDHLRVTGHDTVFLNGGGVVGSVVMAGGALDATTSTGGIQLHVESPGGTHLHALTSSGSLELPPAYGVPRIRTGSGYAVDGVIAGRGPGGQLSLTTERGVISLR